MGTLENWVQTQTTQKRPVINGRELLDRTLKNITVEKTAKGAGAGLFMGIGWVATMGAVPFGLLILLAALGISQAQGLLACFGVGIVVIVVAMIMFSVFQPREAAKIAKNPGKATEEYIKELGGRDALGWEIEKLVFHVTKIIQSGQKNLNSPTRWIVINDQIDSSYTLGDSIFISNQAMKGEYLGAIVAYELARLNNGDGAIRMALRQLETLQRDLPFKDEWVKFWRQQVFIADTFVAQCGYKQELVNYLEHYQPLERNKPWYDQEEPYIDERIDHLVNYYQKIVDAKTAQNPSQ